MDDPSDDNDAELAQAQKYAELITQVQHMEAVLETSTEEIKSAMKHHRQAKASVKGLNQVSFMILVLRTASQFSTYSHAILVIMFLV